MDILTSNSMKFPCKRFVRLSSLGLLSLCLVTACHKPVPGPDKSASGLVLGAAWGAGTGAIIGHQFNALGPGAAIGAGMGAVSGLLTGVSLDVLEGDQLSSGREIQSLKMLSSQSTRRLDYLEEESYQSSKYCSISPFMEVFFDKGRASLKLASVEQISHLAEELRVKRYGSYKLKLRGFSTDLKDNSDNKGLVSARVKSVENILRSNGIPESAISIDASDLSERNASMLVSERDAEGERQNNRVEIFISYL